MLGGAESTERGLVILTQYNFSVALSGAWSYHLSLYPSEQLNCIAKPCFLTSLGQTFRDYDYCRQVLLYISLHILSIELIDLGLHCNCSLFKAAIFNYIHSCHKAHHLYLSQELTLHDFSL